MAEARRRASAMISKAVGMRSMVLAERVAGAAAAAAGHGEEVCVRRRVAAAQPPELLATKLSAGRALQALAVLRISSSDDAVVSSILGFAFLLLGAEREQLSNPRTWPHAEPKKVMCEKRAL